MDNGLTKIQSDSISSEIYNKLLNCLDQFSQYEIENKKTSLHITHGRAFLGVHPRKNALLINIVSNAPLNSARMKKAEKVSANRYHNELIINSASEIDDELTNWLKVAYALTETS